MSSLIGIKFKHRRTERSRVHWLTLLCTCSVVSIQKYQAQYRHQIIYFLLNYSVVYNDMHTTTAAAVSELLFDGSWMIFL